MLHSHEITGEFRPLQDWVVLAPEEVEQKGSILLPEICRQNYYRRCRVVAVGPGFLPYANAVYGRQVIPTELKVGQYVYLQGYVDGEQQFRLNGEDVFMVRERHLSLTIER